jgi:hypothetical protein
VRSIGKIPLAAGYLSDAGTQASWSTHDHDDDDDHGGPPGRTLATSNLASDAPAPGNGGSMRVLATPGLPAVAKLE